MKNIIGTPARGDDFLPREREIAKILRAIDNGSNIQLAAPRRVGKTSILMYLLDNDLDENHYIYLDTEAVASTNHFFKKLYSEIIKSKSISGSVKVIQQLRNAGNSFLKKIKGINVSGAGGIELADVEDLNYYEELTHLLKGVHLDEGKLVLMIDEFPYTISNIIEESNTTEAIEFLQLNRSMRQDPELNSKILFIYTGSIGLNTTVENLNATALINDIMSIKVLPINIDEGKDLVNRILDYEGKSINEDNMDYFLKRVEWLTPFYIKLVIKEIIDLMNIDEKEISANLINDSFQEIIDYRNNNYFEHYYSRLMGFFSGEEFKFIIAILNSIVNTGSITKGEIHNFSVKFKIESEYRSLIHTLIYDGYIHSEDEGDSFRFNSPILRLWWKKYVAN